MTPRKVSYHSTTDLPSSVVREDHIEYGFIGTLQKLKYEYRPDITDRATLEANFREKFESLNRVHLTDSEFSRLMEEIITADVFTAARILRQMNSFVRDDGTPLNYTLVNIRDWCKNTFEVVNQLRINTDNSRGAVQKLDAFMKSQGLDCAPEAVPWRMTKGGGRDGGKLPCWAHTRRDTATAISRPVINITRIMNLFPRLNVRPR